MDTRTTLKTIDQVMNEVEARGSDLTLFVWNGYGYEERPVARRGFGGCLIGKRADVDEAVAQAAGAGYSFGMVIYLDDRPTAIEALTGAIEMLTTIKNGGNFNAIDYIERLQAFEQALARHIANEQRRAA